MRRRLFWLLGGWAVGTLSASWLRRRTRRAIRRYAPARLRHEVSDRSSTLVDSVRRIAGQVAAAGRDEPGGSQSAARSFDRGSPRRHRRPIRSTPGER